MRSNIADLVGSENQGTCIAIHFVILIFFIAGSVFSICTSLQILAFIMTIVVTNETYHPQVNFEDHKSNARITFWVMASAWTITLPLIM